MSVCASAIGFMTGTAFLPVSVVLAVREVTITSRKS